MNAPVAESEEQRIDALHEYEVLDTLNTDSFCVLEAHDSEALS